MVRQKLIKSFLLTLVKLSKWEIDIIFVVSLLIHFFLCEKYEKSWIIKTGLLSCHGFIGLCADILLIAILILIIYISIKMIIKNLKNKKRG